MSQSQLSELLGTDPAAVLAAVVAMALLVAIAQRRRLGPDADWVEVVRSIALPLLDAPMERLLGGVGSVYQIHEREFVTAVENVEAFERVLWRAGFRRNVLSATKRAPDGTEQVSAWVLRDHDAVDERMQLDVQVFADGRVAAHLEPSSALRWLLEDWTVLRDHYRGRGYNPAAGERLFEQAVLGE